MWFGAWVNCGYLDFNKISCQLDLLSLKHYVVILNNYQNHYNLAE